MGTPIDTNAAIAQQQRKEILCAVCADMSQAGKVNEESVPDVKVGLNTSTVLLQVIEGDKGKLVPGIITGPPFP